jgi:hypothetical protein
MLLPTGKSDSRMTTNKRQTLVDFMFYSLCEGQGKAGAFGYSPLPLNLVQAGFEQVAKLGAADPGVDVANRDATRCNNPTFVAGDLNRNKLAEVAAQPAACDQQGQGPCLGEGQVVDTSGGAGAGGGGAGAGAAAGGTAASGGTASGAGAAGAGAGAATGADTTSIDPATGLPVGDTVDAATGAVTGAVATSVAARPVGSSVAFGALAGAELLAVALVPGLVAVRRRGAASRAAGTAPAGAPAVAPAAASSSGVFRAVGTTHGDPPPFSGTRTAPAPASSGPSPSGGGFPAGAVEHPGGHPLGRPGTGMHGVGR